MGDSLGTIPVAVSELLALTPIGRDSASAAGVCQPRRARSARSPYSRSGRVCRQCAVLGEVEPVVMTLRTAYKVVDKGVGIKVSNDASPTPQPYKCPWCVLVKASPL